MSDDDVDVADLVRLSQGLASIDLDAGRADAIAEHAADHIGSASRRGAEILAAGTFVATYLVWVMVHVLDVFS